MGSASEQRVTLTNADKVLYPATGTTKSDIFDYYAGVAEVMLGHIADGRRRASAGLTASTNPRSSKSSWRCRRRLGCHVQRWRTGPGRRPIRSSIAQPGWPGSPNRRRWRCTCRSGGLSPSPDQVS